MRTQEIKVGTVFNTEFECGCIATSIPEWDSFTAIDSEGVECTFNTGMVTLIMDGNGIDASADELRRMFIAPDNEREVEAQIIAHGN